MRQHRLSQRTSGSRDDGDEAVSADDELDRGGSSDPRTFCCNSGVAQGLGLPEAMLWALWRCSTVW